ncbi:MAG: glycosyltransferase family 2 protein [Bernardetiaceae bacterium]|nr:glycosyltransferase family 2 protein [Bernardetiaceae bacterium]
MPQFDKTCSVVVPLYYDEKVVLPLCERLCPVLETTFTTYEIIFVNDGSRDNTWQCVLEAQASYSHIRGLNLVQNVGQQNAIAAGLDHSLYELIVIMDSDLQDKPEDIPKLTEELLSTEGAYMAIAQWESRQDTTIKKLLSKAFNLTVQRITSTKHETNLGVFRVIKRKVVEEISKYKEKTATSISLMYWIGFKYVPVKLHRDSRLAGESGYNLNKMLKMAFDRIFSYSMFPIRLATYTGLSIAVISFIISIVLIIRRIFGEVASGWTSIVVLILFLFGINFIFLGIIGEYLGRIFLESKSRPKYHVGEEV